MHSLPPDYLAKLRFNAQQLATMRALGEYRGKQQLHVAQSPEVLSDLRQVAVVESTESSNRLEGVLVAANRLKSLVPKNATLKVDLSKKWPATLSRVWGAKGDRVRAEILKINLPFSISEIEEACPGISRDMVRVVLRAMKAEGLITPTGKGRAAKWEKIQPSIGQSVTAPSSSF